MVEGYCHSNNGVLGLRRSLASFLDNKGKRYVTNLLNNLNYSPGYGLLDLLLYAKATGTKVNTYDHRGTDCQTFDEVFLQS